MMKQFMKLMMLSVMLIGMTPVAIAEELSVGQQAASASEAQAKAESLLATRLKNACSAHGGVKESRFNECKIENGVGSNMRAECSVTYFCNN